jgi:hypothetical protein
MITVPEVNPALIIFVDISETPTPEGVGFLSQQAYKIPREI